MGQLIRTTCEELLTMLVFSWRNLSWTNCWERWPFLILAFLLPYIHINFFGNFLELLADLRKAQEISFNLTKLNTISPQIWYFFKKNYATAILEARILCVNRNISQFATKERKCFKIFCLVFQENLCSWQKIYATAGPTGPAKYQLCFTIWTVF